MRNDKVVNSQANKERIFHAHMLVESLCILHKNMFYNCSLGSAVFLICFLFSTKCQARVLIELFL